ncbi:DUF1389 domain-containing protein [Chlamydia sp. 12-01]|uniref:DUF1389 domain-containing protein n=1 Tax=Chlamydia sp. 12-01 TaxID=3002742 RepID=UPI0035D447BA
MKASNLFLYQTLPKQEVVCRYMQSKGPTTSQIIMLIVLSLLFVISGLIFLSILPSSINMIISILLGSMGWCTLSFLTARLIIKYSQPKYIQIPLGFRQVIKSKFSRVFFDLVNTKDLTITRFRELIRFIYNFRESRETSIKNELDTPSLQLKDVLEDYDIENLDSAINGEGIPNLDNLLVENCPLYWMKHFIELGNDNILIENGVKRNWRYSGAYWFSELGLIHQPIDNKMEQTTLFNLYLYGLVQELSQEEYSCLMNHSRNNTWDHQDVTSIVDKLVIYCQGDYRRYMSEKDKTCSGELRVEFTEEEVRNLLLRMCLHGLSWNQLQLIRSTPLSSWKFLSWIDKSTPMGGMRMLAGCFLRDFINESNPNYESNIALTTHSELKNITRYKKLMDQPETNTFKNICCYLNHRMRFHEKIIDTDIYLKDVINPCKYSVDSKTGKRDKIII